MNNTIAFISSRFNARETLPRSIRAMRIVSTAGIALGVAALVIASAIGRGFESHYRHALLDFNAHVIVMGGGEIDRPGEVASRLAALRYASEEQERFAARWAWVAPWIDRARGALGVLSSAHGTVALVLSDRPRLAALWQRLDPAGLSACVPAFLEQRAAAIDDVVSRGIVAQTPFLYREALSVGGGAISGVVVKGVDPATMPAVNAMPIVLLAPAASLADALAPKQGEPPPAIAGAALARTLGIADAPKTIRLLVPREGGRRPGSPRFDEVRVVGVFESGMHDYDAQFLLMALPVARAMFGVPGEAVTGIELKLDDPEKAAAVAERIERTMGPRMSAVTWSELNRELLAAVRLEQLVSAVIMGIMVIVAALNIVAVLVLMTIYRFQEISVLKALGLGGRQVAALLVRGGTAVGVAGAAGGLVLGIAAALAIRWLGLVPLDAEIYLVEALPIDISPLLCGMIALFCLGVGFLTSRFAAKRLAEVPIAEGLQRAR